MTPALILLVPKNTLYPLQCAEGQQGRDTMLLTCQTPV